MIVRVVDRVASLYSRQVEVVESDLARGRVEHRRVDVRSDRVRESGADRESCPGS